MILILLILYLTSMRNRCKYSKTRIKRRLNFLVDIIFILTYNTNNCDIIYINNN